MKGSVLLLVILLAAIAVAVGILFFNLSIQISGGGLNATSRLINVTVRP